jgi:serine-type D-Ala-D-Ala carboxypeptidase/endopeptidase (penicillin-binding protein 4)
MKKIQFLTGLLVMIRVAYCADNVTIQKKLSDFLAEKKYNGTGIGIVIKNVETDSCLVKINENELLNPASVSKLVTGAVALELLGTNFNFVTSVYLDQIFNRDSGVVKGNIYIRGGGDPGFTAERLWLLVQHLYHNGIRRIDGNLVVDDSFFDTVSVGPGFDEDSNSRAYQPLISALSVSFNTLAVHVRPGNSVGSPVIVDIFPDVKGVKVSSTAMTSASGKNGGVNVETVSSGNITSVKVSGTMGLDEEPKYVYRKIWQTWEMAGGAIASLFNENKINFRGKVVSGITPDTLCKQLPFYTFESEPLPTFINHMFKYSSNFAAEMLFKTIPSVIDSTRGSWPLGASKILSWWEQKGLPGTPVVKNGSGMGNSNRISAYQIAALLSYVWNQKRFLPEYLNALSVSGVDGTIKSRFKKSPLKGLVRAKTGTLNAYRTSTLAGYMLIPQGNFAFAIFCNSVGNGQYDNWVAQEQILEKFYSCLK